MDEAAFAGLAEVAAFDEHAGDFRIAGEADAAAHEAAIPMRGGDNAGEFLLDTLGEAVAVHAPVEGFGTPGVGAAGIVVHADKHGVRVGIGTGNALIQFNEIIAVPHQDDLELAAEFLTDAAHSVERGVFFQLPGPGAGGTTVLAAMASVENDGAEALGAGTMAVFTASGAGAGAALGRRTGNQKKSRRSGCQ